MKMCMLVVGQFVVLKSNRETVGIPQQTERQMPKKGRVKTKFDSFIQLLMYYSVFILHVDNNHQPTHCSQGTKV